MEKNEQPTMEPMFHALIMVQPPTVVGGKTNIQVLDPGIMLRDHFAANAIAHLLTISAIERIPSTGTDEECAAVLAQQSYLLADAMMQERAKWKGGKRHE